MLSSSLISFSHCVNFLQHSVGMSSSQSMPCVHKFCNIFELTVNGVISPIGSKTLAARKATRLLLYISSCRRSISTMNVNVSLLVSHFTPSAFVILHQSQGSGFSEITLDDALSSSGITSNSSFELLDHLVKLNSAFSINSFALCCSSTALFNSRRQNAESSTYVFLIISSQASGYCSLFLSVCSCMVHIARNQWACNNPEGHKRHSLDFRVCINVKVSPQIPMRVTILFS